MKTKLIAVVLIMAQAYGSMALASKIDLEESKETLPTPLLKVQGSLTEDEGQSMVVVSPLSGNQAPFTSHLSSVTQSSLPLNESSIDLAEMEEVLHHTRTHHSAYCVLEDPPLWKKILRWAGATLFGVAVGNAMIPIILQDLYDNGAYAPEWFWPLALYIGTTFFLETTAHRAEEEHVTKLPSLWSLGAVLQAAVPVYYLSRVEQNHHHDENNADWDKYYTFMAILTPFLFANEFLDIQSLGYSFFKSPRSQAIERSIRALEGDALEKTLDDVFIAKKKHVDLKKEPVPSLSRRHQALRYGLPLVTAPLAYGSYAFMWDELLGSMGVPEGDARDLTKGMMAVFSTAFQGALSYEAITHYERSGLYPLPQGLFKSIPLIALSWRSSQSWPLAVRIPEALTWWAQVALYESRELKETLLKGAKEFKTFQKYDSIKRQQLLDVLR